MTSRKILTIVLIASRRPWAGPILSQIPLPHRGDPACTSAHPCRYR